jgi:hypothetical protein
MMAKNPGGQSALVVGAAGDTVQVNRRAARLGDDKPLTHAYRPSLNFVHLLPLGQSAHPLSVYFWPLASAAEIGSYDSKLYTKYHFEVSLSLISSSYFSYRNLFTCQRLIIFFRPPTLFYSDPAFNFPLVSFTIVMNRKHTAEDYQRTAEENSRI